MRDLGNGSTMEKLADGTKIQTYACLSSCWPSSNRRPSFRSANGTILKLLPGTGSLSFSFPSTDHLEDGTKVQTSKEGIELIVYPDGRKEQTNAKGVKVFTELDGSTRQVNLDGACLRQER